MTMMMMIQMIYQKLTNLTKLPETYQTYSKPTRNLPNLLKKCVVLGVQTMANNIGQLNDEIYIYIYKHKSSLISKSARFIDPVVWSLRTFNLPILKPFYGDMGRISVRRDFTVVQPPSEKLHQVGGTKYWRQHWAATKMR